VQPTTTKAAAITCAVLLASGALGCEEDAPAGQPVPVAPTQAPQTAPAVDTGAAYADEDLPVPPDFEQAADEEITEDNYVEVLEQIEEEMGEKKDAGADAGRPDAGAKPKTPSKSRTVTKSTTTVTPTALPKKK
jgi:hypothetical protein